MPRGLSAELVEPLRAMLVRHLNAGRATQDEVAIALKVSQATVSDIKNGRRGIGIRTLPALAKLLGPSVDALLAGEIVPLNKKPDDYPNRAKALTAWEILGRDPEAAANVSTMAMDRDSDPSPDDWFSEIEREERRLNGERRGKVTPPKPVAFDDAPRMPWKK